MKRRLLLTLLGLVFFTPMVEGTTKGEATHQSSGDAIKSIMKKQGISAEKYKRLKDAKILSDKIETPCWPDAEEYSTADKGILAELVLVGRIAAVTYLYKEGGNYKAIYNIDVEEILRGSFDKKSLSVISRFGPICRDHSLWFTPKNYVQFEAGDRGIFFLSKANALDSMDEEPNAMALLKNKFEFSNPYDYPSMYMLTEENVIDNLYIKNTGITTDSKTLQDVRNAMSSISQ